MPCAAAGSANKQTTTLANAILPTRRPTDWRIIANPPEDYRNPRIRNSLHEISSEESRHGVEFMDDGRGGQRGQKPPPVTLCAETGIEHRQDPPIAAVTDEPPESLAKRQDGQRHLILVEGFAAAGPDGFDPRRGHRLARRGKRQFV